MRYRALPLAALLLACAAPEGNRADNMAAGGEGNGGAPAEVPINDGGTPPPAPAPAPTPDGQQPAGDSERTAAITLSASPESLSPGATVTLRLANGSRGQVGYNLCTSALETAAGAAVRTDRVCTMELRTLEAGQSATYGYELPAGLEPGSYRFSSGVEWMAAGNRTNVTSNSIRVTGS